MRRELPILLAAVLVSAPIVGAVDLGVDEAAGPGDGVPLAAHGGDHPPIRIHGDEQFLLPSSGVTGGSGTAEDPYVISGWTVRPEYVMWDFAGHDPEDDELVAEKCKPSPVAQWEVLGAKARFHGIEIVDTSAHVVIENVTVVPREPTLGPADRFRWDSSVSIGILLRDADHVTIRNVTVGQADGPKLYRGICGKDSDDLILRDSTVQRTINDGVEVTDASEVSIEGSMIRDSAGTKDTTVRGLEAESITDLIVRGTVVADNPSTSLYAVNTPDAVIEGNTVTDGWYGIEMFQSAGAVVESNVVASNVKHGLWIGDSPGVEVHLNNIEGNGADGLHASGVFVNATDNWWGDDSGPSGGVTDDCTGKTADGNGDEIGVTDGATVCFDEWLQESNSNAGA